MASYGEIHFTPFYDTSYQHFHGYNERNLAAKANHWDREYSLHTPSASRIRNRFVSKPGRDEVGRTLSRDTAVQQVLQARTALIGSTFDGSTKNSLRVESRYGDTGRVGENEWPHPTAARSQQSAHEDWADRTAPADRSSSTRMLGSASALRHPSFRRVSAFSGTIGGAADANDATAPWNSRQGSYDSEYTATYCDIKSRANWTTNRPDFYTASLRSYGDPTTHPLDSSAHVHRVSRPLSPTQPLQERQANEKISGVGLESMNRPIHRKQYPALESYPAAARPAPYSFDLRDHISTMRPGGLFRNRTQNQWVSEKRQEKDILLQIPDREQQSLGERGSTFNSHQLTSQ